MKKQVTKISQVSRNRDTGEISFIVGAVYAGRPWYFYYQTWAFGKGLKLYVDAQKDYVTVWGFNQFKIPGKDICAIKKWLYEHYDELSYTLPLMVNVF